VAARGEGVDEVWKAVEAHRAHLETSGEGRQLSEARLKDEAADLVGEWARGEARTLLDRDEELSERLLRDRIPYAAADEILTKQRAELVPERARSKKKPRG